MTRPGVLPAASDASRVSVLHEARKRARRQPKCTECRLVDDFRVMTRTKSALVEDSRGLTRTESALVEDSRNVFHTESRLVEDSRGGAARKSSTRADFGHLALLSARNAASWMISGRPRDRPHDATWGFAGRERYIARLRPPRGAKTCTAAAEMYGMPPRG